MSDLDVRVFTVGPVQENCYIVRSAGDAMCAVIVDPGEEPERLLQAAGSLGVSLDAILITHCHFDHIGAVAPVARATGAPVYCPVIERALLTDVMSWVPQGFGPFENHDPEHTVAGGEHLQLAGLEIDVIFTPGHSPGHLAFWRAADRTLVAGDVLFGRHPATGRPGLHEPPAMFTPDPARNRESIRRLAALEPAVVCFGHGPPWRDPAALSAFAAALPA